MKLESVEAISVRPLRQAVLRPHQDLDELVFQGDHAPDTMHAAVSDGQSAVGVATVLHEACNGGPRPADWQVRGMATSADMRGCGLGSILLASCEAHARARGGTRIWCNARASARGFYERAGFTVDGENFLIPVIGWHVLMSKPLERAGLLSSSDASQWGSLDHGSPEILTRTVISERSVAEELASPSDLQALTHLVQQDIAAHGMSVIRGTNVTATDCISLALRLLCTTEPGPDLELARTITDVRYDGTARMPDGHFCDFTNDRFPVHTDMAYAADPPKLLLTQCVHPGAVGEGNGLLADCRVAWAAIPPASRAVLSRQLFTFAYPPDCPMRRTEPLAVSAYHAGARAWRFRPDGMAYPPETAEAVASFHDALNAATVEHKYIAGDLLVVDNRRIVHGHTAFRATGAEPRHLRRAFCQPATCE